VLTHILLHCAVFLFMRRLSVITTDSGKHFGLVVRGQRELQSSKTLDR
jgi:hypothetical protein